LCQHTSELDSERAVSCDIPNRRSPQSPRSAWRFRAQQRDNRAAMSDALLIVACLFGGLFVVLLVIYCVLKRRQPKVSFCKKNARTWTPSCFCPPLVAVVLRLLVHDEWMWFAGRTRRRAPVSEFCFSRSTSLIRTTKSACSRGGQQSASRLVLQLSVRLRSNRCLADRFFVPYSDLRFGKLLGKGSQGEVFKANWRWFRCALASVSSQPMLSVAVQSVYRCGQED
jgi:hypothetical protein